MSEDILSAPVLDAAGVAITETRVALSALRVAIQCRALTTITEEQEKNMARLEENLERLVRVALDLHDELREVRLVDWKLRSQFVRKPKSDGSG